MECAYYFASLNGIAFNLIFRTPLRNQKQFQTIGVRRIFEAVIRQVGAVTSG